ncbi:MAG: hypothetical protein GY795_36940 [Desulfobacterales bacterium]|nr:hypothetical protein [Desulfobacterales bacterium]
MVIFTVIAIAVSQGCQQDSVFQVKKGENISEIKLIRYTQTADRTAEKVLDEFNKSDGCERFGCPFYLKDYKKEIKEHTFENRKIIVVFYNLTKPLTFRGHPEHFSIWIYKDTLETQVIGGM